MTHTAGFILNPPDSPTLEALRSGAALSEAFPLDRLPPSLRNVVRLARETMGRLGGDIRHVMSPQKSAGSLAMMGDLEGDAETIEAHRRTVERFLAEVEKYSKLYTRVAIKVAIAEKAADIAIVDLDKDLNDLKNAIKTGITPRLAAEKAIYEKKALRDRLKDFRDKKLRKHREKLESDTPPDINELESIEKDIDNTVSKHQIFQDAFSHVSKYAAMPFRALGKRFHSLTASASEIPVDYSVPSFERSYRPPERRSPSSNEDGRDNRPGLSAA